MQLEATAEAGHERGRGDRCGMWGAKIPIRHRNQSFRALHAARDAAEYVKKEGPHED